MQPEQSPQIHNAWWIGKKFRIVLASTGKKETTLTLGEELITFSDQTNKIKRQLKLNDLIGIQTKMDSQKEVRSYTLIGFPKVKKWMRSEARYVETMIEFSLAAKTSKEEYQKNATQLEEALKQCIANNYNKTPLKLLIYFNPISGANSKKHLVKITEFLAKTNFQYDILTTERKDHCKQHLQTIEKSNYRAAVIVSGDGLVHQFLNSGVEMPMTHVPAGSGNGFAKTQTYTAGQACRDQEAIFLVIKNRKKAFNVTKYELEKLQRPVYSFMFFQWCILADLDMNSQFLRFLGGLRFDVYGFWRLVKVKNYRGKLYFSETESVLPPLNEEIKEDSGFTVIDDIFTHMAMINTPYLSDKYNFAPKIRVEEQKMDQQIILSSDGRVQLTKYFLAADGGHHFDQKEDRPKDGYNFKYNKIKSFRLEPLGPIEQHGVFGIDGQRYDAQRIQGYICDKKIITFV